MQAKTSFSIHQNYCKSNMLVLAFLWIASMLSGMRFAYLTGSHLSALMHTILMGCVSIIGMVIVNFFPLLLSAAAVYFSLPAIVEMLLFFKAFSYGYCLMGSVIAFQLSGWFVHVFLTFSDSVMVFLLLWFLLRQMDGGRGMLKRDFLICFIVAIVITVVDCFLVSSFLEKLMNIV